MPTCMRACAYVHACVCLHACVRVPTCMRACTYVHACVCLRACVRVPTCMRARVYVRPRVYSTRIYSGVCTCVYRGGGVCTCVYTVEGVHKTINKNHTCPACGYVLGCIAGRRGAWSRLARMTFPILKRGMRSRETISIMIPPPTRATAKCSITMSPLTQSTSSEVWAPGALVPFYRFYLTLV